MNFQEMNKWILSACALFVWGAASVRAQQPVLCFGSDKTFKIAQFTDMHLDPSKPRRLAEAEKTFARLDRILATERPDLVVFTGDVVTGAPAEGMWRRLLDTMTARRVPFCVVLGNHDSEQDLSRQQIGRIVTSCPEKGVCLGYGRFSGDNTTYNNLRPGVRLLLLTEGERGFETWIREDDGRMVDHARFAEGKIMEIAVER